MADNDLAAHRTSAAPQRRLTCLDGLRGVAALMVVFHHFAAAFAPSWTIWGNAHPNPIIGSPLAIVTDGSFPVIVFFVLSGFVLSRSSKRNREALPLRAFKRYLRLGLPALSSCIAGWMLIQLFPSASARALDIARTLWLSNVHYRPEYPTLARALYEGLIAAFSSNDLSINVVLWTMRIELLGSLVVYVVFSRLMAPAKAAIVVAVLALVNFVPVLSHLFHLSFVIAFFLGMGLEFAWGRGWMRPSILALPLILAGIYLGGTLLNPMTGFFYRPLLRVAPFVPGEPLAVGALGAGLLVAGILLSPRAQALLDTAPGRWLGRTSFGLYLIHFPIQLTLFSWLFVHTGLIKTAWGTAIGFFIFTAMSLTGGWLVTRLVDEPVLTMLRRIGPSGKRAQTRIEAPVAKIDAPLAPQGAAEPVPSGAAAS